MPRRSLRAPGALALFVACLIVLVGCGHAGAPRYRLGSLPFPGPFTLYAAATGDLGGHHYGDQPREGAAREVGRGTLYTCHAGFVDVAHLRESIDWTRHVYERVLAAFAERAPRLVFEGPDDTHYELGFDYPPQWAALSRDEQRRAAIRIAQRSSLLIMTWHEVLTGSGYKTTGVVSERRSAFTYDDMSAHVIGVGVAGQALADTDAFDRAVTHALATRLAALGMVDHACLDQALELVEGTWWHGRFALRLQRETGRFAGQLEPFVIEDLACCPDTTPEPLAWPPDDLPSLDLDALVSIDLLPQSRSSRRIAGGERIAADDVYRWVEALPD
jgi:hypothetical protein